MKYRVSEQLSTPSHFESMTCNIKACGFIKCKILIQRLNRDGIEKAGHLC